MIKVYSLKDGRLLFTGGDPRRPLRFVESGILSDGADGMEPEDLARRLEVIARMVRETAQMLEQSAPPPSASEAGRTK